MASDGPELLRTPTTTLIFRPPVNGHPERRLPNTLSVSFPQVEANTLLSEIQEVAASAGLGLLVPFSATASAVFEVSYDGARFEQSDSESRILAGMNWQVHLRGKVRAAVAAGLADRSADAEFIVGYAFVF